MNSSEPVSQGESSFLSEVVQASGEKVQACYQCLKCSAGCPVAYAMDIPIRSLDKFNTIIGRGFSHPKRSGSVPPATPVVSGAPITLISQKSWIP